MASPIHIKYRGHVYVAADVSAEGLYPHHRCPKGKHWNEPQHKCLPLPPELAQHQDRGMHHYYQSLQARARGEQHKREGRSEQSAEAYQTAAEHEHKAARHFGKAYAAARKHGYSDMARNMKYRAFSSHREMFNHIDAAGGY